MESIAQPIQLDFDTPHLCECGCGRPTPIVKRSRPEWGYIQGEATRFIRGHSGRRDLRERFLSYVDKTDTCWLWTGLKNENGYGRLNVNKKAMLANRLAHDLFVGPIPDGLFVCHKCDVPACVNPDHLWLGTNADNMHDMIAKGRQNRSSRLKGSAHHKARLTENDITIIRTARASGEKLTDIAARYAVDVTTIGHICSRKNWKHVA